MRLDARLTWLYKPGELERRMARKQRRTLFRLGGYAKKVMRSREVLGKKTKKISPPGDPPRAHGDKTLLKNRTLFDVEPTRGAVVIGPELVRGLDSLDSSIPGPALLNEGGQAVITTNTTRRRKARPTRRRVTIQARPFTDRTRAKTLPFWLELQQNEPF